MNYTIYATRTYDKSLKNIPPKTKKFIEKHIFILETNPNKGKPLRHELKSLFSLHLKHQNTQYRIIYSVDKRKKEIMLRYAGSRENIYKKVRRLKL